MKKRVLVTILLCFAIFLSTNGETVVKSKAKVYSEGETIEENVQDDEILEDDSLQKDLELEENENSSQLLDEKKEVVESTDEKTLPEDNAQSQMQNTMLRVASVSQIKTSVNYQTHIQDIGWQGYRTNGEVSGTSGQSKRLEAIQIFLQNLEYSGNIEYQTHIQDIGWQSYRSNGDMSGTSGQSKRLEAIRIRLTGDIANYYDVYYRVHAQDLGWLGWAKNDEPAGSSGYGYRLEAIEIKLVPKGETLDQSVKAYHHKEVEYQTHIQDIGWQDIKADGETSGTTGESKRLEAIEVKLNEQEYAGNIQYKSHIEDFGWEADWKMNGQMSGTSGQSKRIEAVQIELTGEMEQKYDVYYRVHAQAFGWLGWTKNGEYAGTAGYSCRLEAIEIKLVKKSETGPSSDTGAYFSRKIGYSSQIEDIGWQDYKYDGEQAGTTGQAKRLETYKIILISPGYSGGVEYKSYVEGKGWEDNYLTNGQESGTVGQSKRIEAVQMRLTGEIADYYDIYYKVHAQAFGELGWAKNGEYAGTYGYSCRVEALEIRLVKKSDVLSNGIKAYLENVDGYFVIASAIDNNKVLDAYGELTKDGSNISIHDRIDSLAQIWRIDKDKQGNYVIKSSLNPNVLLTADNFNVALYSNNSSDNQVWMVKDYGDGYISLISKANSLYMDIYGANTTNGTRIQLIDGNGTNAQKFKLISYNGNLIYKGMDVSDHQTVDWNVAQYIINFAIIRLGFGSDYSDQDDLQFINNVRGCEENNIPYGIYIYSYALNVGDAMSEAYHTLRLLKEVGPNFQLGVWFDMEDADGYKLRNGFFDGNQATKEVDISEAYLNIMSSNGYHAGLYASLSWLEGDLNSPKIEGYDKWVAHWNGPVTYDSAKQHSTSYSKPYRYWQFCSDGHIPGVRGGDYDDVDLDLGYNIFI